MSAFPTFGKQFVAWNSAQFKFLKVTSYFKLKIHSVHALLVIRLGLQCSYS